MPPETGAEPSPPRPSRAQLIGGAAGFVLLVLIVLVVVGQTSLGAAGVLVVLGVVVLVLQVGLLGIGLLLVRRVSRSVSAQERTGGLVHRRTKRLIRLGREAAQRDRSLHRRVDDLDRQLATITKEARRDTANDRTLSDRRHLNTQRQVQALLALGTTVDLSGAAVPAGGWPASPDLLLLCTQLLRDESPVTLVECGSGLSTLYLALTVAQYDLPTKVVALEHDEKYATLTRELLARHGVAEHAEVRLAPLAEAGIPGHETPWYDPKALEGLDQIGVLLVDGPPADTGPQSRYPAVPLLADRLARRCVVVMDDTIRVQEKEIAQRWAQEHPDLELELLGDYQKGVGLLRRG